MKYEVLGGVEGSDLKIEAGNSFETLLTISRTTRCQNPEHRYLSLVCWLCKLFPPTSQAFQAHLVRGNFRQQNRQGWRLFTDYSLWSWGMAFHWAVKVALRISHYPDGDLATWRNKCQGCVVASCQTWVCFACHTAHIDEWLKWT